jgi:hypothetical protein
MANMQSIAHGKGRFFIASLGELLDTGADSWDGLHRETLSLA